MTKPLLKGCALTPLWLDPVMTRRVGRSWLSTARSVGLPAGLCPRVPDWQV